MLKEKLNTNNFQNQHIDSRIKAIILYKKSDILLSEADNHLINHNVKTYKIILTKLTVKTSNRFIRTDAKIS